MMLYEAVLIGAFWLSFPSKSATVIANLADCPESCSDCMLDPCSVRNAAQPLYGPFSACNWNGSCKQITLTSYYNRTSSCDNGYLPSCPLKEESQKPLNRFKEKFEINEFYESEYLFANLTDFLGGTETPLPLTDVGDFFSEVDPHCPLPNPNQQRLRLRRDTKGHLYSDARFEGMSNCPLRISARVSTCCRTDGNTAYLYTACLLPVFDPPWYKMVSRGNVSFAGILVDFGSIRCCPGGGHPGEYELLNVTVSFDFTEEEKASGRIVGFKQHNQLLSRQFKENRCYNKCPCKLRTKEAEVSFTGTQLRRKSGTRTGSSDYQCNHKHDAQLFITNSPST
eukprot:m.199485 g.199485  ORF g.199485 m.199485 type:complete len:339 (+) comp39572_c0_seq3:30-1046(+)